MKTLATTHHATTPTAAPAEQRAALPAPLTDRIAIGVAGIRLALPPEGGVNAVHCLAGQRGGLGDPLRHLQIIGQIVGTARLLHHVPEIAQNTQEFFPFFDPALVSGPNVGARDRFRQSIYMFGLPLEDLRQQCRLADFLPKLDSGIGRSFRPILRPFQIDISALRCSASYLVRARWMVRSLISGSASPNRSRR
ncbi:hypothetical protein H9N28_10120 [Rhodobacter capsulatus]|uniref:hypothetical protein n=1 Tax=Rhodobacter capsulatus TaxID=1061 RepID=UPI001364AFDA|nr:hypothetical protein [Rhodobacter capsulatus]QNR61966.1 hypothetical protein H9N28_10120 [Rhodobacter capsulatus]